MIKSFTLLLFVLSSLMNIGSNKDIPTVTLHEFHISKCQIKYSEESKALQISMHLFLDDLEEAMREQGADNMYLCTDKEHEKAEKYLYRYLQQRFKLVVNEQAVSFDFIGKEQSEDLQAVWCYLEVTDIQAFKKLEITNSLLMEIFEDQKNIIHVEAPGHKKGYFLLQKGQERDEVTF